VSSLYSSKFWSLGSRKLFVSIALRTNSKDIHSDELSTVLCDPCPLSDDLGRPYHLVEDLLVDGSEGSGTRSLLLVGGSRVSLGFGEDTSLGEEDDVFVGKLLLELSGEPIGLKEWV
jgi:hypothetical protein